MPRHVFGASDALRYRFSAHVNDLVIERFELRSSTPSESGLKQGEKGAAC